MWEGFAEEAIHDNGYLLAAIKTAQKKELNDEEKRTLIRGKIGEACQKYLTNELSDFGLYRSLGEISGCVNLAASSQ